MTTSPTTANEALVAALASLVDPVKDGHVNAGQRRYSFLTLGQLLTSVREAFAPHGLAVAQLLCTTDTGHASIETRILHSSGVALTSGPLYFDASRVPQEFGSQVTYLKRYQLGALVGITGDDDDGAAASTRPVVTRTQQKAADPDPYTRPLTQTPDARPVDPSERPDPGSPSTTNLASEKSKKMMWALLRGTGMDTDQTRLWMGSVLNRDGDWHTDDLTQFEVSSIIDRLKSEPN